MPASKTQMTQRFRRRSTALVALAIGVFGMAHDATTASAASPSHLTWAMSVATSVTPPNNAYGSDPTVLTWAGVNGAPEYTNRTVCNTFVNRVLMQAYGYTFSDFTSWMGTTSPLASHWYDSIVAQNRLSRITSVTSIAAGDIVAVKYLEANATTSGHVMIAVATPVKRTTGAPAVKGTTQYELTVVDSANSGHGPTDTRRNADGTWNDGAGVGVIRLYVNAKGTIVGSTWSTLPNSTYEPASSHPVAVGRLV
jgi:hypothetical protein